MHEQITMNLGERFSLCHRIVSRDIELTRISESVQASALNRLMGIDGSWTTARSLRRPLQTKLISGNFTNITLPKRTVGKIGASRSLKDVQLTSFGFVKTCDMLSNKRKRGAEVEVQEVKDSQLDSDDELFPHCTHAELELASAFDRLASPSKRCKASGIESEFDLSIATCENGMSTNTSIVTPRKGSILSDLTEVPSSLPYERFDNRRWSEPDTPVKVARTPLKRIKMISPPPSSSLATYQQSRFNEISPFKSSAIATNTPSGIQKQLHTPPDTTLTRSRSILEIPESSPIPIHSDEDTETAGNDEDDNNKENKRPPFVEIVHSLVPSSQTRARQYSQSPTLKKSCPLRPEPEVHKAPISVTSLSRSETPTVWHDAVETLSQVADTPAKNRPSSSQVAAAASALVPQGLRKFHTIEDSQHDEADDVFTMARAIPYPQSSPTIHKSSDQSSLWNTLLPPGFRSSQFEPMTPGLDSISQTCPLPPSDTQITPGSPSKRRIPSSLSHDARYGKRQKNRELEADDGRSPTLGIRHRVDNLPSNNHMLPPPPLFSLPSTADE